MRNSSCKLHSFVSSDGALIVDVSRDLVIRLNASGGEIWQRLQSGESAEEIAQRIALQTGMDLDVVRRDLGAFKVALDRLQITERR